MSSGISKVVYCPSWMVCRNYCAEVNLVGASLGSALNPRWHTMHTSREIVNDSSVKVKIAPLEQPRSIRHMVASFKVRQCKHRGKLTLL
jgi:hypothetical protein